MGLPDRQPFGPLAGLRVLDFTQALAGPFGTQVLGDLGAEVVKVESPDGDGTRRAETFHPSDVERLHSGYFHSVNRNKLSIVIDLKSSEGRQVVRALAPGFDVVTENFRTGVMERLGLSYETLREINPRLVYGALRGFGDPRGGESPYVDWPAFDVVAQAMGGMMGVTGPGPGQPTKVGPGVGDTIPGLYMAIGILSAVIHARESGKGQFVDVAMLDCVLAVSERIVHQYTMGGRVPGPEGSHHPFIVPFGIFPAKDGHVALACTGEAFFHAMSDALEAPELLSDPATGDAAARVANRQSAIDAIGEVTSRFTKRELMVRLGGRAPFGPVYDAADIADEPHFKIREMLRTFEAPGSRAPITVAGVPIKLSETPGGVHAPGPRLGEHSRAILSNAGVSPAEIDRWIANGTVHDPGG